MPPRMVLVLAVAGLLPVTGAAQQTLDRGFPINAEASIRIQLAAGRVRITGWDHDSVAVSGQIPARGGTYYGGGRGEAAKLGIESSDPAAPGSLLDVRVPRRARVWVRTVTASIEAASLESEVELISVGGAITVTGAPRILSAESMDGLLLVEGKQLGVARLRSGSGGIVVRGAAGDVTATAVGGSVDLYAEQVDRARLESVTGAVRFTGTVASNGSLEAETHGADVTLRFTGPVDAEFTLASVAGQVLNRLTKSVETARGKPLTFLVGSGGARISARSFKGTVTVSR